MSYLKIKIPVFTYLYIVLMLIGGYGKVLVASFILLSIHELSHLGMTLLLNRKVIRLIIYPFGMAMEVEAIEYMPSIYEGLIATAGPLSIYISHIFLGVLFENALISSHYYQYLINLNTNLFLFNMLPIYPLDGGRILHALCHLFFPFQMASILCFVLSFICAIWIAFSYEVTILYIYTVILGVLLVGRIWQLPNSIRSFHLYRYIHLLHSQKVRKNKGKVLYRNVASYMVRFSCMEHDYLRHLFTPHIRK